MTGGTIPASNQVGACILVGSGATLSALIPTPDHPQLPRMLQVKECLRDGLGRDISYLRVSVNARSNLAGVYANDSPGPSGDRPMSRREVIRLVQVFTSLGIRKVRLTGGEPLLRRDLETLIAGIAPEVEGRVHLSTNGLLLARRARSLRDAGLRGVNIRLDAADRGSFRRLTGRDGLGRVLAGLEVARAVGLGIKLNAMVARGVNEDQILPLARLAQQEGLLVRFIEFLPQAGNAWGGGRFMAATEILQTLQEGLGLSLEAEPSLGPEEGPARLYRVPGSETRVGLIATLSAPTCDHCHRVRLGSHGQLKACIFGGLPVDLLGPLRSHTSHEDVVRLVRQALTLKQGCLPLPDGGLPHLTRGPRQVRG